MIITQYRLMVSVRRDEDASTSKDAEPGADDRPTRSPWRAWTSTRRVANPVNE
jgi:hypothetical protein